MMRKVRRFLDKIVGYHNDCPCRQMEAWSMCNGKVTGFGYEGIYYDAIEVSFDDEVAL